MKRKNILSVFGFLLITVFFVSSAYADSCIRQYSFNHKTNRFDKENLPRKFELNQNYPNPYNPTTKIKYTIPSIINQQSSIVNLKVYNVLRREVANLVNEQQPPGNYEVTLNSRQTINGKQMSSGVYVYRLIPGAENVSKKMMVLK